MDQSLRDFASKFAEGVIAENFTAAHKMLAPWLQKTISATELEDRLAAAGDGLPEPARFSLDANRGTYDDLKEPDGFPPRSEPFDPELTAANFRKWMCIEFKPDDDPDFDACYDLWIAVVDAGGKLAVGYFEASGAD